MQKLKNGMLYLVATPIGNLDDITLRALKVLRSVDRIACEDTRHSLRLLEHFHIHKPLFSYQEHNERQAALHIAESIENGQNIALISDAGMPLISDPGAVVVSLFIERGLPYTVVPGANAGLTGLVASGFSTQSFCFFGFLPVKGKSRKDHLDKISQTRDTAILYEAPHRLIRTLEDLKAVCPGRRIALCRELTKKFEEIEHLELDSLDTQTIRPRGEYVLIIEGHEISNPEFDIEALLISYLESGMSKKDAVKTVSQNYNLPRNDVYNISLLIDPMLY